MGKYKLSHYRDKVDNNIILILYNNTIRHFIDYYNLI